jgi:hypothetical protein
MNFRHLLRLNKVPLWVTIIVGSVVGVLSGFGIIPNEKATTVILVLLVVLAIDGFIERVGYLEKMESSLHGLHQTVANENKGIRDAIKEIRDAIAADKAQFSTREALNTLKPFKSFLAGGNDIFISGLTLVGIVGPLFKFLERKVQEGATLRFLLLDERDGSLLKYAALAHGVPVDALRNDIRSSIAHFNQLIEAVGEDKQDAVLIRLLKTLPTASITMVAPHSSGFMSGEIRCELYTYKTEVYARPAFRLTPADDMFVQYKTAIEDLWKDSEPYNVRVT